MYGLLAILFICQLVWLYFFLMNWFFPEYTGKRPPVVTKDPNDKLKSLRLSRAGRIPRYCPFHAAKHLTPGKMAILDTKNCSICTTSKGIA